MANQSAHFYDGANETGKREADSGSYSRGGGHIAPAGWDQS